MLFDAYRRQRGRALLTFSTITLLILMFGFSLTLPVQAAVFNPGCAATVGNAAQLVTAVTTANSNGQADTINLVAGCTYTVVSTLSFTNDSGNAVTINGNGATIDGADAVRVILLNPSANLTLNAVTIANGSAIEGGGINVDQGFLTLTNSTVTSSSAFNGGGIYSNGSVTITNSTFTNNASTSGGGGGGAIRISGGLMDVNRSTFSGNTAVFAGGAIEALGGTPVIVGSTFTNNSAGEVGGALSNSTIAAVVNSTFNGNTALNGGNISTSGTLTMNSSTLSGGTATFAGGGLQTSGGTTTVNNTIIANSVLGGDCVRSSGTLNVNHSLIEGGLTCVNGTNTNNLTGDPKLGTLTGSPAYFPLPADSLAMNTGNSTLVPITINTDQRGVGFPRLQGTNVEMGSFEAQCMTFPYTVPASNTLQLILAADCASATPANDTINLTNSTYTFTGMPATIKGTVTINGNNAILDGGGVSRIFVLNSTANAALNSMTLRESFTNVTNRGGGAIFLEEGTLAITNITFSNNEAVFPALGGGAIYNRRGFMTVTGSSFTGNDAYAVGGAIWHDVGPGSVPMETTITNSTFTNNDANDGTGAGGAIYTAGGTVNIDRSTFSNHIVQSGGAIFNYSAMTVRNSTFSNNSASQNGGAIDNGGGSLYLINSTVTGNSAGSTGGGGIYNSNNGVLNVINSTISANFATANGGNFYAEGGLVVFHNTILANNTGGGDCARRSSGPFLGTVHAQNSLIEDGLGCVNGTNTANLTGDPSLGTLTGSPAYFPLAATSIALNKGDSGFLPPEITTDQRGAGFPRVQGTNVDMGSFEVQCMTFPYTVPASNTGQLNLAIDCASAIAGNQVINLASNSTYMLTGTALSVTGDMTLNGNNATINGANISLIFHLHPAADLTMNNMTLRNANLQTDLIVPGGGAIYNNEGTLNATNIDFIDNVANFGTLYGGAAIYNDEGNITVSGSTFINNDGRSIGGAIINDTGVITISDSTISGSTAAASGGALYTTNTGGGSGSVTLIRTTFEGNSSGLGGAIINSGSTVNIIASTFINNSFTGGGGSGGAIYNSGGMLNVTNSTFNANVAGPNGGGGIFMTGTVTVTNSTFSGNSATGDGGGDIYAFGGTLTLNNSILANSAGGGNCVSRVGINAPVVNAQNNIIEGGLTCITGTNIANLTGDPGLGALTGSPQYFPITTNSIAYNSGSNALVPGGITTDQAGNARIAHTTVDRGSYEVPASSIVVTLTLQGRPGGASPTKVITAHVQIRPTGSTTPISSQDHVSNTNGQFTMSNILTGTYDIWIKGTHTLAVLHNVALVPGSNTLTTSLLREGDASDNNQIVLQDFSLLAAAFGTAVGNPGYNPQADFNNDGLVQLIDFSLLASNFNQAGVP